MRVDVDPPWKYNAKTIELSYDDAGDRRNYVSGLQLRKGRYANQVPGRCAGKTVPIQDMIRRLNSSLGKFKITHFELAEWEPRLFDELYQPALTLTHPHMPVALIPLDIVIIQRVGINADW